MKTVCSANMPYVREAFETLGDAVVLEGRSISAADVRDADLLALRSTTQVNESLLSGSSVKFVGTATIGIDHFDIPYMESQGIHWCYSPGCNANSVSEYFTAALLCVANRHDFSLEGKTLGVVGVGNVGSKVVQKALSLGLRVLPNDPPRERAEGGNLKPEVNFSALPQVQAEADIISFHVPLEKAGQDPTCHMADAAFFERLKPGCIFINGARGAVVDTDALLSAMDKGIVSHAIIDTWEGEPAYREDLLARVDIATPHIAGHSFEGKVAGTVMVYREACQFLGKEPTWTPDDLLPEPIVPRLEIDVGGRSDDTVLWEIVHQVYDIESDDRRLRYPRAKSRPWRDECQACPAEGEGPGVRKGESLDPAKHFDSLRKNYPVRREFRFTEIALKDGSERLKNKIVGLGFRV